MQIKHNKKPIRRSSEILKEIAESKQVEEDLTFAYIIKLLGERGFGFMMLFFSLPCMLPLSIIPGFAFLFSLPIMIFSVEMIYGRKSVLLPKKIAEIPISQKRISKIIIKVLPYLIKVERFTSPRWLFMTTRLADIINGLTILLIVLLLMLPIPFSNLYFGMLLVLFSLGIIEEDGLLIVVAYLGLALYIFLFALLIIKAINLFL